MHLAMVAITENPLLNMLETMLYKAAASLEIADLESRCEDCGDGSVGKDAFYASMRT